MVTVIVNHRVNIASSVNETAAHVYHTLLPAAQSLDLALTGFGRSHTPSGSARGHVYLSEAYERGHGPAPISSTDLGNEAWKVLAGTARGVWASRTEVSADGSVVELDKEEELIMSPFMGTGVSPHPYWLNPGIAKLKSGRTPIRGGIGTSPGTFTDGNFS